MNELKSCPKCGAVSGDDWRQCEGSCPMPGSPHYENYREPGEFGEGATGRRAEQSERKFALGDMVRKKSGSWWEGRVVGFYSTEQTPDGVCVQLDKPMGPVQIYPASALEGERC